MTGALQQIRVLDVTHVLAGPFCTYQMALLGADVIKVESPTAPDCARGRGPDPAGNAAGLGLTYQVQGGNKRAIALDLASEAGADVFRKLVRDSDVLVENFTTGTMDRLGLGYDALSQINSALVYCSLTGFGDTGPEAATGAYDNIIQAASGIIAQSGGAKPGVSFVDYSAGYAAAYAVCAALVQRGRTGRGCRISVSMLEVAMQMMAPEAAAMQYAQANPRNDLQRPKEAGIATYRTASGQLMLGAFHPAQYRKLGALLDTLGKGIPALAQIIDWPDVWAISETLQRALEDVFMTNCADSWVTLLQAADLPAARVATLAEAVGHPQLAARGYFASAPDGGGAALPLTGFYMSEGGAVLDRAPPAHGADTAAVLAELGYDPDTISALRRAGAVQ